ncbi:pyrimidine-nucleoside phosphorylase [Shouchella lehensis]|uniref:Pyrimidine-nucleoside phosphorylase n=1 Tax=Shouchella lehensis TaxID=300825 RepID=A0A4Y7WJ63_9BACI|nr:pyrimidine-nucleoside phosphorylase [Shouchella lehensis]MBG9785815.1 thymidine phosphorylase [Shouchella lehensis]RQW20107.1 pyrimidine-nucleoside phosphorylase [Bacillus sp. C1-1]TES48284.1 pyrimidine-nucleoside phosphorylase [Shouchella lehensis]
MRMVDIIEKKRDGLSLTKEEIRWFIGEYTANRIPDYQVSALAMAIYFQDMDQLERAELTLAMAESGDQIDLTSINGIKVDKHSTGGVGDKTTIALVPLVAAAGVPVAKMSGRGLGHTGGTIDKLEAIPGFSCDMETTDFLHQVQSKGLAVAGQTGNLTPADKQLYGLRDVTGTVNSMALIASSIMSKKIASGSDAIVLDVKTGSGAFMKTLDDSTGLAKAMVDIGANVGRKTMAVISDMNQPLGEGVGNAIEIQEAIDVLKGNGPEDVLELCLVLGSHMVYLAEKASSVEEARKQLEEVIENGKAVEMMKVFIESQGGNPAVIDDETLFPQARYQIDVPAVEAGYVYEIATDKIGVAAMQLGAGRATKEDQIDLAVGLKLKKKIGDRVDVGDILVTLYANREEVEDIKDLVQKSYHMQEGEPAPTTLIYKEIYPEKA